MSPEIMEQVLHMIDAEAQSRSTAIDYELAYQVRVAIDRIRFAIRQTEAFAPRTDQMRETGLQLVDALQRLETVDYKFQERSRTSSQSSHDRAGRPAEANRHQKPANGHTRVHSAANAMAEKTRD